MSPHDNNNNNNNSILNNNNGSQDPVPIKFTVESATPRFQLPNHATNYTVSEYLLERAKYWAGIGKTTWIIDASSGVQHTFADFDSATASAAAWLYKHGMRRNGHHSTLIYMTNELSQLVFVQMGVWRVNGIVRAVYPEEDEDTLTSIVQESHAGWILCDCTNSDVALAAAARVSWNVHIVVTKGNIYGCTPLSELFQADVEGAVPVRESKSGDICAILCTSGTTGRPKGAVHTHATLLNQLEQTSSYGWLADKPNFLLSKGTHVTGLLSPFGCLIAGKSCLVIPKINLDSVYKAIDTYKPGLIYGFPPFLTTLVNHQEASNYDLSSLEVCIATGAPLNSSFESTMKKLPNISSVLNWYGMTETGGLTTDLDYGVPPNKIHGASPLSAGKPGPGVSLQIRDPETGKTLCSNQPGEICIKSDVQLFHSYYLNKEATESAYTSDGWFKTGDLGYYDIAGFLFIVDRLKEIFKYYGNHISPTELEDVICKHPRVSMACVIGVVDPEGGDHIPRAFVTCKSGIKCDPEEIKSFVDEALPDYKHLRGGCFIIDELPRGKTGKISRQLVGQIKV